MEKRKRFLQDMLSNDSAEPAPEVPHRPVTQEELQEHDEVYSALNVFATHFGVPPKKTGEGEK